MYEHRLTRKLGSIDVNQPSEQIELRSFWCSIVRTEWMNWYTKEHSHSFWELHLCLQGTAPHHHFSLVSELQLQPPDFALAHCSAWGQPTQTAPRFFSRMR